MGLYDSFLTPFASPSLGRIDVSGLEDAGKMLEQRAQYDQNRQDRLAKEAKDYALEEQSTQGKNRYYDAQSQTHRMQIEQAKNADTEKRARVLFDSFRKAKTPNERKAISDELQRLGFAVEEQDTELPPSAAPTQPSAGEAPAVPASGRPKAPKVKTPKANAGFMSALGQIVSDDNAQEAPVDESTLGPGSLSSVLGIPGAGGTAGTAGGAASAMQEIPASRGGRFVIKDKSGATVHSYDEPLERMKSQMAIKGALGAMGIAATNDREKSAVEAASQAGAQMLDLGLAPDQAVKYAVDIYGKTLNQEFKKSPVAGVGGGGGGPSKTELKIEGMDREETDRIIKRVGGQYDMKATSQAINMARGALNSLKQGSGMSDLDAFKRYLVQMSGKVVTDKEMDQFLSSTGKWTKWEKMVNEYTESGRFPEEFRAELTHMMDTFIQNAERHRHSLGENARKQAELEHLGPDAQAVAYGHFTEDYSGAGPTQPLRRGGAGAAGGGSPARAPEQSDEDLVKAWKAGRR